MPFLGRVPKRKRKKSKKKEKTNSDLRDLREVVENVRTEKYRWNDGLNKDIQSIITRIVRDTQDFDGLTREGIVKVLRKKLGGISLDPYGEHINSCLVRASQDLGKVVSIQFFIFPYVHKC